MKIKSKLHSHSEISSTAASKPNKYIINIKYQNKYKNTVSSYRNLQYISNKQVLGATLLVHWSVLNL